MGGESYHHHHHHNRDSLLGSGVSSQSRMYSDAVKPNMSNISGLDSSTVFINNNATKSNNRTRKTSCKKKKKKSHDDEKSKISGSVFVDKNTGMNYESFSGHSEDSEDVEESLELQDLIHHFRKLALNKLQTSHYCIEKKHLAAISMAFSVNFAKVPNSSSPVNVNNHTVVTSTANSSSEEFSEEPKKSNETYRTNIAKDVPNKEEDSDLEDPEMWTWLLDLSMARLRSFVKNDLPEIQEIFREI